MKANTLFREFVSGEVQRLSGLKSYARFLLPDSFVQLSCATLLCFLASWGALILARTPAEADILWPANGIVLAFMLMVPRSYWASYLAGGILASVAVHEMISFPFPQSWIFTAGNTLEALLAAFWLAPRGQGSDFEPPDFTDLRTLGRFLFFGVMLAPLLTIAFVQLMLIAVGRPFNLLQVVTYVVGDTFGIAIMTPLILAIHVDELRRLFTPARRMETIGILAGLTLFSAGIFLQNGLSPIILLFLILLLAIFRLGSSGAAISVFLVSLPAAYLTIHHHGPFATPAGASKSEVIHSIFELQCFLAGILVTIYSVSAALAEHDKFHQELAGSSRRTRSFAVLDRNVPDRIGLLDRAGLDKATGLANRRAFDRLLVREWRRALREKTNLSLLLIDVDHFKLYNDHYGRVAGDACLQSVASLLTKSPLCAAEMTARYGGEEFVVLLPGAGLQGSTMIAEVIRHRVIDAALPHIGSLPGIVTVSVGVATVRPSETMREAALVEMAEAALGQAKSDGRNLVRNVLLGQAAKDAAAASASNSSPA